MENTFAALGLIPQLVKAVDECGYKEPTPVQQQSIPIALAGRDVVGSAQTGTGKTAAFMLPILQRMYANPKPGMRALVLVPTRELAEQVLQNTRAYAKHLGIKAQAVYGGVGMEPQTKALRKGVEVVVATPGRFLDHMERGNVKPAGLEFLVLDEADRMLDMGFSKDVHKILDFLPKGRQTLFFTATISPEVDRLAKHALDDHAAVEIGGRAETAEGVQHILLAVDKQDKRGALTTLLQGVADNARTLIFTRTKYGADKLAHHLKKDGVEVAALHGGKTQPMRTKTLDRFRSGKIRLLVATDVAARGIDVSNIHMVVNFDVPQDPEVYVHRVGRTARAGTQGLALTLMSPDEWLMMRDIEKLMGRTLNRDVVPGYEPSVPPAGPNDHIEKKSKKKSSIRGRRGIARRR